MPTTCGGSKRPNGARRTGAGARAAVRSARRRCARRRRRWARRCRPTTGASWPPRARPHECRAVAQRTSAAPPRPLLSGAADPPAARRDDLFEYLMQRDSNAQSFFRKEYGVVLRDLVPVAEPAGVNGCMLVHLGAGEHFGWCYLWHHDDPWELAAPQPSFEAAIAELMAGIERRDPETRFFLGLFVE